MLITEVQPNSLLALPISQGIIWQFREDEHVIAEGAPALLDAIFASGGGGVDGQTFTFGGVEFSTDSSVPYTETTFDYSGTEEESAQNFAGMIRSNYRFVGWTVSVIETGLWIVRVIRNQDGLISADDGEVDFAGVVPVINNTQFLGENREVRNEWLWWQLWEGLDELCSRKVSPISGEGLVAVDVRSVAKSVLRYVDPYLAWTRPEVDPLASRRVYLRYGTYEIDGDGNRTFSRAYESAEVLVAACRRKVKDTLGMSPYSPEYTLPVKWLDSRDRVRCTLRGTFEFSAILLYRTAVLPDAVWRVKYEYYIGEVVFATSTRDIREEGFVHVPIGPQNLCHSPANIEQADRYTVTMEVSDGSGGWLQYSEILELELIRNECTGGEVYYRGDLGAWQTLMFDRLSREDIEVGAVQWERDVELNENGVSEDLIQLYHGGGVGRKVVDEREVVVLESKPLTDENRYEVEQMLVSERVFMRVQGEQLVGTRRVIPEAGSFVLYQRDESVRAVVVFRFNTERTAV